MRKYQVGTTRSLVMALMASTSLTSVAFAQTATPPPATAPAQPAQPAAPSAPPATVVPAAPKQAPVAKAPAPAQKSAQDFGTVYAEPPKPNVVLTQPGLTASPTDYAAARDRAAQQRPAAASTTGSAVTPTSGTADVGVPSTTPGGVTRQDIGGGYIINEEATKTRSTATRDAIDKLSPTANPYQIINLLPGVSQSSTDNTGLNGGNIRLRGFNSDKVGLTIEGAPVNDSGNYALFPQEYVDAENICQVSIAQGSPDLDSPHIGSVGGVINLYMCDPSKTAGGLASYSVGSNNLNREFFRGETGQIGNVRAYASVSRLTQDHWAAPGRDERMHYDFKAVVDLSPGNVVRFSAIYNDATNNFYVNPNMTQFLTPSFKPGFLPVLPGSFFNTTSPIDQGTGRSSFYNSTTSSTGNTNYFNYRVNPFQNLILSAPSNFTINEKLKFDTVPYFWFGYGNGGGVSIINEASANATGNTFFVGNTRITGANFGGTNALTDRIAYYNPSITETYRPGVINKFTYNAGDHQIVFGHWLEFARHRQTAPYESLDPNGNIVDPFTASSGISLPSGATCRIANGPQAGSTVACPTGPIQRRDQLTETTTNMVFIGDSWKITEQFSIEFGVKHVIINRDLQNYLPNALQSTFNYSDSSTLPTVGARYRLNKENMVFANYSESFRSPANFTGLESYNTNTGQRTPISIPAPERGRSVEVGHRYQGSMFSTSVSGFYGWFDNYQQSTNVIDTLSGSSVPFTTTINAGGLIHYGINAEIGFRPIMNFRPYLSGELLHTELQNNLAAGANDFLATKGKQLPGASNQSAGVGLDYDDKHIIGNVSYKYIGSQFSTFTNDEQIKAFGRVDMMIGYRFSDIGFLKQPEIKLNLFNILNARNLTGVNGITGNSTTTRGINGTTIAGSAPTYFQGQDFSGLLTFRTGF